MTRGAFTQPVAFSHGTVISFWHLPNPKEHLADTATAAITRMSVAYLCSSATQIDVSEKFSQLETQVGGTSQFPRLERSWKALDHLALKK